MLTYGDSFVSNKIKHCFFTLLTGRLRFSEDDHHVTKDTCELTYFLFVTNVK